MFSLEHNDFQNVARFPTMLKWLFSSMNVSASLNRECVAAHGADGYKCLFGANAEPFVQTPMFILNSKCNTWQQKAILGLDCDIRRCAAAEEAFFAAYGRRLRALPPCPCATPPS